MAHITLNGAQLPNPSDVEIGKFAITKAGRSASGLMNLEVIAKKKTVTVKYSYLSQTDLQAILGNLDSRTFHTLTYPDPQGPGGVGTLTVYLGDLSYKPWRLKAGVWWWQEISIPFVER